MVCDYCGGVMIEIGGEYVCITCWDLDEMEKTPLARDREDSITKGENLAVLFFNFRFRFLNFVLIDYQN